MTLLSLAGRSRAAAPESHPATAARLLVTSTSECPRAADVAAELEPLLTRAHVTSTRSPAIADAEVAAIHDRGSSVEIEVRGVRRSFDDPERDCAERAREAAVFIGLVIEPPSLPQTPRKEAPPPTDPPTTHLEQPAMPMSLELGARAQLAPWSDSEDTPLLFGLGVRAAWGRRWGISVGGAAFLPQTLHFEAADSRIVWLPLDLSLRLNWISSTPRLGVEVGPVAAALFASGRNVGGASDAFRLELGARGALRAEWPALAPLPSFVSLYGIVLPRPYEFELASGRHVGSMPSLWLGAELGFSFGP